MKKELPLLCVYNAENISSSLQLSLEAVKDKILFNAPYSESWIDEIESSLAEHQAAIIINAKAEVPEYWIERLTQTLADHEKIQVCSALSCQYYELSPLKYGQKFDGSYQELDQLIYLAQRPKIFFSNQLNQDCFIVRNKKALKQLSHLPYYACNNLLVQSQTQLQATESREIGNQVPLPAHALEYLHWKLPHLKLPKSATESKNQQGSCYFQLDSKPVLLHITMSWGGGIQKWIDDFSQHEKNYHHLVLSSKGELYRHAHGEALRLSYNRCQSLEIETFEMQAPIQSTCIQHDEYQSILASVIADFGVSAIIVSSLIGHSFECLQTGLPTLRVLHDYFPSWPSLTANLEAEKLGKTELKQALLQTQDEPFGEISADAYEALKTQVHEIYSHPEVQLIAPSQSVVNNLIKIDPKLNQNQFEIIPHGIKPLQNVNVSSAKKTFDVLVLGRINPPKGQKLLEDVMQQLGNEVNFAFIGAGNEGKKYLKVRNICVIQDYEQNELSKLLAETQPNLALITSITSETFNYTLSELQSANIPVLSTPFGALKERIVDGENGFLVEADAGLMAAKIKQLKNSPELLQAVIKNLNQAQPVSIQDMLKNYRNTLKVQAKSNYHYALAGNSQNSWVKQLAATDNEKHRIEDLLEVSQSDLKERTQWAKNLTKELKTAHKNIELERNEVEYLQSTLKSESERMTTEIEKLNQEFGRLSNNFEDLNDQFNQTSHELRETTADLNTVNQEIEKVYASRSWRVTKPLRRFTTWARHKRNAAKFRWTQLKSLPTRTVRSLKTRGLGGTLKLIQGKLKHQQPTQPEKTQVQVQLQHEYSTFSLKPSKSPLVSVIVPVYNHFHHTYNCLKSLAELKDKTQFEVIVVDDCSSDETEEKIKLIDGIVYHRQKQNGGFIESCNTGATLAKGEFLLFLNNDTVVHENWLDSLVTVFSEFPDAGLVGSKLVYPNGQLQEAGGIVFADASGWNYGRLGDPDEPCYNHLREVDYCSGASILVRKTDFEELGCFDQRYKPAYYEDTDLAFAIREKGLKVYYQPASVVTHFEGISSGTDLSSGVKKYQVVNQQKFKDKWQKQLQNQTKSGNDIELSRIHGQPQRILIFDACTPTPDQDSGSLRMLNLIKILKQLKYHVVFMAENLSFVEGYTQNLQQLGVECIYAPSITNPMDYLQQKGKYFDHILLSRYYVAEPVMPFLREYCPNAKLIFDTVDLHFVRERRMAEIESDTKLAKIAEQTREKELAVAKACDTTLVVSPYEVGVLNEEIPGSEIKVLTNIHEIYGCRKPYSERKDIMFIGGYQHTPNVDAVEWFVESIFPLVEKQLPELKFHIIGSKAPKHIQNMARDNIVFHGFVEDIEPFMDDIRIAVAPLRYGAGVKGKVNMSMSYGQPVVGTKVAVEGMYTQEAVDVLMAETPEEFASQIVRLYKDEKLWNKISKGGLKNVENYFSFEAAKAAIEDIL